MEFNHQVYELIERDTSGKFNCPEVSFGCIIINMKTQVANINPKHIDDSIIERGGNIIKNGGLVAFPTETVYGLGADALNEEAAVRIYQAKGRPSDNPLIVHIEEIDALYEITREVPREAILLAKAFWPGPLTLIFHKNERVPFGTTGGLDTVAVRMPDSEIARRLIHAAGGFVAAPSANLSGKPSPTLASHVIEDLSGVVDMIIDGGMVTIGVESTIIDMTVHPPMMLRPGAITKDMLEDVIGVVEEDKTLMRDSDKEAPKAPGMKYRHYAPKAPLIIIEGEMSRVTNAIDEFTRAQEKEGKRVGIIATEETMLLYHSKMVKSIGNRQQEETIAHHLYQILREFDEENVDIIYSESFDTDGIGKAIMNRLLKAAGHHIIKV